MASTLNADNGVVSGSAGLKSSADSSGVLALQTNGTTAVTVDTAQNVGVGVTPSAWGSSWKSLDMAYATTLATNDAGTAAYGSNWRNDGSSYIYKSGGYAGMYMSSSATSQVHRWFVAGSGSGGGTISFTQAMTLDASGNLLVGTTTNAGRTTIYGATSDSSTYALRVRSASGTDGLIVRSEPYVGIPNNYTITTASAANMYFGADGFIYRSTSSARYKTDIQTYDKGIDAVLKLRPVYYKANRPDVDGNIPTEQFAGLIAEEVDAAGLTEFVVYNDENQPDALHYGNMVSLAFKAIQEQQTLIQDQLAIINSLTARVTALEGAKA